MDTYKTIKGRFQGDYREKGSKFFAFLIPIKSEEELKEFILSLKKEHPQSRHACYGYRLGHMGEKYRANDDGEPNNSAGMPILNTLLSYEVTNCASVVIRYFGGTKLGVPGLINAYKTATKLALDEAKIVDVVIRESIFFEYPYDKTGEFMRIAGKYDVVYKDPTFSESCLQELKIRMSDVKPLLQEISETYGITIQDEH
ncbi:MAG: putative YigZ family protein [Sphingobacteriales bacterium]